MPDHLALAQQVERASAVEQLDGAAAHDPDVARGLRPLAAGSTAPRGWNSISAAPATASSSASSSASNGACASQEVGDVVDHAPLSVAGRTPAWPGPASARRRGRGPAAAPPSCPRTRRCPPRCARRSAGSSRAAARASRFLRRGPGLLLGLAVERARDLARVDQLLAGDLAARSPPLQRTNPPSSTTSVSRAPGHRAGALDDEQVRRRPAAAGRAAARGEQRRRPPRAPHAATARRRGAGRRRRAGRRVARVALDRLDAAEEEVRRAERARPRARRLERVDVDAGLGVERRRPRSAGAARRSPRRRAMPRSTTFTTTCRIAERIRLEPALPSAELDLAVARARPSAPSSTASAGPAGVREEAERVEVLLAHHVVQVDAGARARRRPSPRRSCT